jgi:hypothetical protein
MDVVECGDDFGAFYSGGEAVERRGDGGRRWWCFVKTLAVARRRSDKMGRHFAKGRR